MPIVLKKSNWRAVIVLTAVVLCPTIASAQGVLEGRPIAPGALPQTEPARLQWRPVIHSSSIHTDEVFPAEILAMATRPAQRTPAGYLGDPNGMFGVIVTSPSANARVQVTITVDQLSQASSFDATLPDVGRTYEIWPTIRFDSRALASVKEGFPATAHFAVSMDGAQVGQQSRTVRVRSVNDVPFRYVTTNGQHLDFSYMFAAFVNENSPVIDRILKEALAVNAVQRFKGYQGTPQEVTREVFAVWNVLQRRGVRYSSITQPSGQSRSVYSQHVRFLDEVVDNQQANCVDGSVLFASVLYKLGIYPALVLVPGHMFVGFFADTARQQPVFLETTLIGNPGLSTFQQTWKFLTDDGYLTSRSYELFRYAITVGNQKFQQAAPQLQAKTPGYMLIDVDAVRKLGISPIARF